MGKRPPITETHPHLLAEWDYAKNGNLLPENVTHGSRKKVWWRCKKESCGHEWKAAISSRSSGRGCPACVNQVVTNKNNLEVVNPELAKEWNFVRNGDLKPSDVTFRSGRKVWWKCSKEGCGYEWVARIYSRYKGSGCAACAGQVATSKNNLAVKAPYLLLEWDYDRNGSLLPENFMPCSHKKVWWHCLKMGCLHKWEAVIMSRYNGCGCPACVNQVVTAKNNLAANNPLLVKEWNYAKNGSLLPSQVTTGSDSKVWWKCSKDDCGHEWYAFIYKRSQGKGCPACAGRVATDKNNLAVMNPGLAKEWNYAKNGNLRPEDVTPGSDKKVWWKCSKDGCNHEWEAHVYSRTYGYGCQKCSRGNISAMSQKWLDSINIPQEFREHYIKELRFRVDGFDPITNTVYEFLGDYWHGNPKIFSAEERNPSNKKTFGRLNKETINRLRSLRKVGYKVVYIWESDFINQESISNKVLGELNARN